MTYYDEMFRRFRPGRFMQGSDPAWVPQEMSPGGGLIQPSGWVENGPATVKIDEDGITITDGALTIQDEFGQTSMEASGFSGDWSDFISLGLYNARFLRGTAGSVPAGRTAALPYWEVIDESTGWAFTYVAGEGIKATWTGIGVQANVISDKVPVTPMSWYEVAWTYKANVAAGSIRNNPYVFWYDKDGAYITAVAIADQSVTTSKTTATAAVPDAVQAPYNAYYAKVKHRIQELTTHDAANSLTIMSCSFKPRGTTTEPAARVPDDAFVTASPTTGTHNDYDPGSDAVNLASIVRLTGGAGDVVLTGLVAPNFGKRLLRLYAYNIGSLQLDNESGSSTAANRFNMPNDANIKVNGGGGWVDLMYDDASSRWVVAGTAGEEPAAVDPNMTPVALNDTSGTDSVTCTTAGTYYALPNAESPTFTPAYVGQRWLVMASLGMYVSSAPGSITAHLDIRSSGNTLIETIGNARWEPVHTGQWGTVSVFGVFTADDTVARKIKIYVTSDTNGDTVTGAFYNLVAVPLP